MIVVATEAIRLYSHQRSPCYVSAELLLSLILMTARSNRWSQKPEERPRMSEVVEALEWMIVEEVSPKY